ncbi:MAG: 50S ribosomal protein L30 [Acidipila sp.]|nr:50S ribosomal protein L30 [Acidipila sp.]
MTKKKENMLRIKWVVSFIACPRDMRQTIRGLGFRRMHQVLELPDTPSNRGMLLKVRHLVEVDGVHAKN